MAEVTIRGLVNTTYLREGERATVERTDTIDDLVAKGLVVVERTGVERAAINDHVVRGKFGALRKGDLDTVELADTEPEFLKGGYVTPDYDAVRATIQVGEKYVTPDGGVYEVVAAEEPPTSGKGATRAKWAAWLEANDMPVDKSDTKNDLIERWMGRAVQS